MNAQTPRHIAIIGSGCPAGCFTAQALRRHWKDAEITIFDRLAAPYGLIRYGVAANHQHTKAVTRQFDRNFSSGDFRFAGNIEVGTDIDLASIRDEFDIVVLATGRWRDRTLTGPGAHLDGVLVSGDIVNALDTVPRPNIPMPAIGQKVVVVGAGNVALDMVRFLIKTATDYADSDVSPEALDSYLDSPATHVTVLSRSPIASAKADVAMIRELGKIPGVRITVANSSPATEDNTLGRKREAAFAELSSHEVENARAHVHFVFGATPSRIGGTQHVETVHLSAAPAGEASAIPADTVISAIGFDAQRPGALALCRGVRFHPFGRPRPHRPRTLPLGMAQARTGGCNSANRSDAHQVAKEIIADFESTDVESADSPSASSGGYEALPQTLRDQAVSFTDGGASMLRSSRMRTNRDVSGASSMTTRTCSPPHTLRMHDSHLRRHERRSRAQDLHSWEHRTKEMK